MIEVSLKQIVLCVMEYKNIAAVEAAYDKSVVAEELEVLLKTRGYMESALRNGHSEEFKKESNRQWSIKTARRMIADGEKMLADLGEEV